MFGFGQKPQQRVDHHVSDQMHALFRTPFTAQIRHAGRLRNKQHVRNGVGHDTVDFLGHRAIEASQPSLDMSNGDMQLDRRKRRCHCRVDVAHHHDPVETPAVAGSLFESIFEPFDHAGGLLAMFAGAYLQTDVGPPYAQLLKEDVAEIFVVVLSRVDEHGVCARIHFQRVEQGAPSS